MNPIQYALNDLRHKIPEEILRLAFSSNHVGGIPNRWQSNNQIQSIDAGLREKIIDGRVNVDCNLRGSLQIAVDLSTVRYDRLDNYVKVFRIPKDLTHNRSIVSIQTLHYYNGSIVSRYSGSMDPVSAAVNDLYRAASSMPVVSTANCQLVGENVVMVSDSAEVNSASFVLLCTIENDGEMNDLNPGAYHVYAQMVEYATKSYIYNSLGLTIDQGYLSGGLELGRLREIVDGYSDANEMYMTLLTEKWGKVTFTNDRQRMSRFIGSFFGKR